jgi:hypothetical protein
MAKVLYLDRELKPIPEIEWKKLAADPSYTIVRQYDNAVVQLTLKWSGRVENPSNTFPDYYPVFVILVKNYKADGMLANDPVEGDRTFANEADGIAAYETFLTRWTECSVDPDGAFIEADNDLTPPAPPDPNKPTTESEELGDVGAW